MLLSRSWCCSQRPILPPASSAGLRADEAFAGPPRVDGQWAPPWNSRCASSAAAVAMGCGAGPWCGLSSERCGALSDAGWGSPRTQLPAISCLAGSCLETCTWWALLPLPRSGVLATAPSGLTGVALGLTGHQVLRKKSSSHVCSKRRTSTRNGCAQPRRKGRGAQGAGMHRDHCMGAKGLVRPQDGQ